MKTETHRSLLSITFCVLLLFLLPASLAFAEGNSESTSFTFQVDDHGIMTLEGSGPLDAEAFAELNEDARLSVLAVSVPEGVTEIGDGALSNFRNLQGIVLPDSVGRIGAKAFQNCESLSSLTLPANLRELEADAFEGCGALKAVCRWCDSGIKASMLPEGLNLKIMHRPNMAFASYAWGADGTFCAASAPCVHHNHGPIYERVRTDVLVIEEPTCEEKGCVEAAAVFLNPGFGIRTQEVTVPASHRLIHHAAAAAGCENGAVQEYWECDLCGSLFGNAAATWKIGAPAVGKPLGHNYAFSDYAERPTCQDDGLARYVCTRCGDERTEEVLASPRYHVYDYEHQDGAWKSTCSEHGGVVYHCTVCGAKTVVELPLLDHEWGDWVVEKEATEDATGLKTAKCKNCDARVHAVIPKKK
ncbi:MAG: leucine-rich repeat domain-containing protein [Oscillospiraceae bacterium]|nr:leucine-rich repeat domain-containing protein [Oscillospiraceae bacterium]